MLINISTSKKNQPIVTRLTQKLPKGTKENVIARIALTFSLASGKRFAVSEFNVYDSQGKEYKDHILFDPKHKDIYIALICQCYGINKSNENITKYVKLHIDHGLELLDVLFENNKDYGFIEFLIEHLDKGINAIDDAPVSLDPVDNFSQNIVKSIFTGEIPIEIGKELGSGNPIVYSFNDTRKYNNQHIAIAGASGTGKTQFALEFLRQMSVKTQGQVNFLFLDFKGIKKQDLENLKDFFTETQTSFIEAPDAPFPLNPLTFIDNINEKNKLVGINKFVDIIAKYSNIGKKQQQLLKDATKESFIDKPIGVYPSLEDIYDIILEKMGDKRDTLTELMERLSEYELFDKSSNSQGTFLNKNYYLSLSGELDNTVRFTSVFLIINYIFNVFTNMGGSPVENSYRGMRYVLLIDEAHDLFREKKSLEILEVLLRKIRSYGVSIVLLSQGISEYNQNGFDFSQECETSFLLKINDIGNTKAISKFMGLSDNEGAKAARSLENIQKGQAITNIKEFIKAELFELCQFYKK